jgi:hypothetical protein
MPILKYFLWVGGGLLALLFAADLYVPKHAMRAEVPHTYHIAIASPVRPGVEALTFSGETRDFGRPPAMTVVDFSTQPDAASQAATERTLQARAEVSAVSTSAQQDAKPARQKVAKRKVKRYREPDARDVAYVPDGWRREQPFGLAFARPFSW